MTVRLHMKNKAFYSLFLGATIIVGSIGASHLLSSSTTKEAEDISHQEKFQRDYNIYSLTIPEKVSLAGEEVPLQMVDVREKLDRELLVNTYWQSNMLLYIKRSKKWFPVIEPILKEEGVPEDFKYLALIESGLTPVVSPAGAEGFWQIMEETGKELGLEINSEVDERYHVEKATRAACKYLKDAHEKYNNWTLAAASYNMGKTGLDRQLDRQQVENYYDLLLNEETARYIFRLLSAKLILAQPEAYGFKFRSKDLWHQIETKTLTVDTAIDNLATFAKDHEINYKVLKNLNPWLRRNHLTNSRGKTYEIKVPTQEAIHLVTRQN